MNEYAYTKIIVDENWTVISRNDGLFIPLDPVNSDYQAYLKWLEENKGE